MKIIYHGYQHFHQFQNIALGHILITIAMKINIILKFIVSVKIQMVLLIVLI